MTQRLPKTVLVLGLVSFFTDCSSEMIYPLLPVFLSTTLGASPLQLGVIEGIAETTASLLKMASGIWTDRSGRRKPLVVLGYGLAGFARPFIGIATAWETVLGIRFVDRIGKGLRSSPRDALIADVTPPEKRGAAFGLHRSMDHAGAVVGPLLASAALAWGIGLRNVFFLAAVPALIAFAITIVGIRETQATAQSSKAEGPGFFSGMSRDWSSLGSTFKTVLFALFLFTLGNATDAFLLVRLSGAGVPAAWIAGLWAVFHVVKMVSTFYGGKLSDSWGRRRMIVVGWMAYGAIYAGFAFTESPKVLIALFLAYGLYFGLTEPAEKAWIASTAPASLRGTAFGFYHLVVGLAALPASILFGWIWSQWSAGAAFSFGAVLALIASAILTFGIRASRAQV